MKKIIYIADFQSFFDDETKSYEILSAILPKDICNIVNRETILDEVIENIVKLYNNKGLLELDKYLMEESLIIQEEREIIIEALSLYTLSNELFERQLYNMEQENSF